MAPVKSKISTSHSSSIELSAVAQRNAITLSHPFAFLLSATPSKYASSFKSMEMARMSCSFAFNGLNPCSSQALTPSAHSRSNSTYSPQGLCEFSSRLFTFIFHIIMEMARIELASEMIPKKHLHS